MGDCCGKIRDLFVHGERLDHVLYVLIDVEHPELAACTQVVLTNLQRGVAEVSLVNFVWLVVPQIPLVNAITCDSEELMRVLAKLDIFELIIGQQAACI